MAARQGPGAAEPDRMISVALAGQGQTFRLDTPDPGLIGPWLLAIFRNPEPPPQPGYPLEYLLRIQ